MVVSSLFIELTEFSNAADEFSDVREYKSILGIFFFSSRRRHTIYIGDWSSDVCSSDLVFKVPKQRGRLDAIFPPGIIVGNERAPQHDALQQIGRASCRERV